MASYKAVVSAHHKRADGSYPVKIRITHKRVSRWLPTNITAYPSDLTRSLTFRPNLQFKCDDLIRQMRDSIADLSSFTLNEHDVDWLVGMIKRRMAGEVFHLDFFEFGRNYVFDTKKEGTQTTYMAAMRMFAQYLGQEHIDINDITHAMLLDYIQWYRKKYPQFSGLQYKSHLTLLGHIFQKAKDTYNDEDHDEYLIPRSPFKNIPREPRISQGASNLGEELMQRIINAETDVWQERAALDVFILSFILMGANMADLVEAAAFDSSTWSYKRKKTRDRRADHAQMKVDIPKEAIPYIMRLGWNTNGWWLGALHSSPFRRGASYAANRHLRAWAERNGIKPFTFYAARKTWASIARKVGVEKATIDECLAHVGTMRMADIYIEKDYDLMNRANRRVLDSLQWPEL